MPHHLESVLSGTESFITPIMPPWWQSANSTPPVCRFLVIYDCYKIYHVKAWREGRTKCEEK